MFRVTVNNPNEQSSENSDGKVPTDKTAATDFLIFLPSKNAICVGVGQIRSDDSNDSGNQKLKEHKGEIKTASSHIKPRCCLCSSCLIQHETQHSENLLTMSMYHKKYICSSVCFI